MRLLAPFATAALGTVTLLGLGTGVHMTRICHAAGHAQYQPQLSDRCIKGYRNGVTP